jgi:hypoxanthine phosphoribosyltransferase
MVRALALRLRAADVAPDCVVGIARGGCVPAVALSHLLPPAEFYLMRAQVHGSDEIRAGKRETVLIESFAGTRELEGRRVLLVDDVLHSGATALACCQFVLRAGAAAVHFTALIQDTFEIEDPIPRLPCPVITAERINAWIIFPWEPT